MKRGIGRQVAIQRTITYSYTRADLIRLLRLPEDAVIECDGTVIDAVAGEPDDDAGCSLKVHVLESIASKPRAAKEAA